MKSEQGKEMIECPKIARDDIEMDPSGYYFLIRPNFRYGYLEVAVCHPTDGQAAHIPDQEEPFGVRFNKIKFIFYGQSAQDIYHKILLETKCVTSMTHAAYLGKELKKAELALALGIKGHYQE